MKRFALNQPYPVIHLYFFPMQKKVYFMTLRKDYSVIDDAALIPQQMGKNKQILAKGPRLIDILKQLHLTKEGILESS